MQRLRLIRLRLSSMTPELTPEQLAQIHAACFPERPWSEDELAELIAKPTSLLVCSPCGQGFALSQVVAGEAELLTIAVAPIAQRAGIGAALLQTLVKALADSAVERLFLEVARDNAAARALYHTAGFAKVGMRKAYYARAGQAAVDALVLSREISA